MKISDSAVQTLALPHCTAEQSLTTPAMFTRGQRLYLPLKRGFDIVAAALALLVLSPILLLVALAVLVIHGAPVTFVQERVTQHGRLFRLRKFRTMHQIDPGRRLLTDEQRLTRFGSWLRSSSLDELPSLWNILIGDMSVIGPRPLLPEYVPLYSPEQLTRHHVRAGLTGLAQVSGRNGLPWDARLELDHRYILLIGPLTDLHVLLRTFSTVIGREGITEDDHVTTTDFPGPLRTPRLRFAPTGTEDEWLAITPTGEHISRCSLQQTGPQSAQLRLHRLPTPGLPAGVSEALLAETVTLLINRVRARELDHAVVELPAAEEQLIELCARLGFRPSDDRSVRSPAPDCRVRLQISVGYPAPSHSNTGQGASR